jgi:hypothetical protein
MWLGAALIMAAVMCLPALNASAQQGGGGQRMTDEERDAAWTLEATGVSKELGLNEADTGKVVAAYKKSRESHRAASDELRASGAQGPDMFQQMQEIATTERGKLATELEAAIGKEKADKAVATLGTYNRSWDRFVNVLASFGLDAGKQQQGLGHIAKYVVEADKAQQEAMASFDIDGMRTKMGELKTALDTSMGGVLSAEQLATWKERTAGRGGPGGGGGGGGPGQD